MRGGRKEIGERQRNPSRAVRPPPVAPVDGLCVASQEGAHDPRQRDRPVSYQEVDAIRHEGSGVDWHVRRPDTLPAASEKVLGVLVIAKGGAAFRPPHHDVVEGIWRIQARAAGHSGGTAAQSTERSHGRVSDHLSYLATSPTIDSSG